MRQGRLSSVPAPDEWEIVFIDDRERDERIWRLHTKGLTPEQIGREIGVGAQQVLRRLRRIRRESGSEGMGCARR